MARLKTNSHTSRIILAASLVATLMPLGYSQPAFATSSHSVSTCAGLQTLGADDSTKLDTIDITADLDCIGSTFAPLYQTNPFGGTLDGHGHQISHLTINYPGDQSIGFIAQANNATIRNLTLASGSVTGGQYAGGLVAYANVITVTGVTSHLDVSSDSPMVGGLIGSLIGASPSLIEDVAVTGDVSVSAMLGMSDDYVGGLIGFMASGDGADFIIRRASATGNITASTMSQRIGGLIGEVAAIGTTSPSSVLIEDSYASGDVYSGSSSFQVGGLMGSTQPVGTGASATITLNHTYASGAVTGHDGVGGLIGVHNAASNGSVLHIDHSFASGPVTASNRNAGLVGANYFAPPQVSAATDSFYDGPGTGQSVCATINALTGGCTRIDTGAQPDYFKGNHANAPFAGWDFAAVWMTVAGDYPVLIPFDDGDGIDRADEAAAPNSGDANGDGTADAAQSNVASFPDAVNGHYAVLQSSCGRLDSVQVGAESTAAGQTDIAYAYPGGLIRFAAIGCSLGATVTITQHFYDLSDPGPFVMRKSDSGNHTYTTIPGAVFSAETIGGHTALRAVYQVTDGSTLDADHTVDGNIVDPAGPAVNVLGAPNTGLGGLGR